MARYKLVIEYDGAPLGGGPRHPNGPSVQQALEEAAERLCGVPTRIFGAGRTDTGVHASGQVAHVDFDKPYTADTVRDALNAHMRPNPIAIVAAKVVDEAFDARHSARARHYRYRIINRRAPLALEQKAWQVAGPLDEAAMAEGARHLIGRHDFTTFRASQCQAQSPVRTLDVLSVERHSDHIVIGASARSFLHHQVRSMVGSLVEVGLGRWQPRHMADALAARSRAACGPVAPAAGLTLTKVDYEDASWT
ncbi:MAG: tRNA pseudouridine(38-40) synthase TruA [Pseudomonadota bacterium]